ncbi:hypothetical protein I7I51_04811 [Histoplasma capsulatum]|uniref:Uncharacterized protein n=1 Tax=Ajellomyces capsulatus TaxID=5037 RepID=A0A8A1M338_AJECA|nr:predicted protein [Histoplasma mississippiense (nom. inval.)]EDN09415.1 predicted protein [Histoplasma mississippiense (nom. inval.)]QSS60015.1 hypothetical protein I7I51_04811 [Histoplasma capsulatum]
MFVSMIVHIDELIEDPTIHTKHCSVCCYISIPRTMSRCTLEHGSCGRTDRVADNDQDKEPTCPSKDIANEYTVFRTRSGPCCLPEKRMKLQGPIPTIMVIESLAETTCISYIPASRVIIGRTLNMQKADACHILHSTQLNPFTLE